MGNHLIHTQVLEAEFRNKSAALVGQKSLQEIYYQHLIPVMEQVMNEYDQEGTAIRIEKLDLDLGRIPKELPLDLIKQGLRIALEEQLRKIYVEHTYLNPNKFKNTSSTHKGEKESSESDWEILVHFLQKGKLPWFASSLIGFSITQIFQKILVLNPDRLKNWLSKNPIPWTTAQRINKLAHNYELKLIHGILLKEVISDYDFKILGKILKELGKNKTISSQEIEQRFMAILLFAVYGKTGEFKTYLNSGLRVISEKNTDLSKRNSDFLAQLIWVTLYPKNNSSFLIDDFHRDLLKLSRNQKIASKWKLDTFWIKSISSIALNQKKKSDLSTMEKLMSNQKDIEIPAIKIQNPKEDEKTVIHNAGLVLTTAFLPRFFENIGLVQSGKFISAAAQSTAAILLQSMMPEQSDWEEPDLILNKILCGMEPAETVEFSGELDPKFILESKLLLESMASQWVALKSKSGKMVTEGFFAREGILKKVQRGYQLQIQRLPFDILLDRLPWTIGIIKLPWMKEIISVEW
ncbi:contractile injection system tape measure protein [Algoriphagus persicinus]|uniref:contractile injection system tape measure protein n=1 Tax=Algoriphagus persicinus TaxID=3108754 RepID=UPI002B3E1CD8|nr:contractile injection system tape measure protein [Algoriphagus sp. E1-3-M2]MEB2783083.1 contractile injection system tape measure protein [Algoriphagus sp. E1-3-M2]